MREIKFRAYDPNNKKMVYGLTLFNTQTIYNKFHNEVHPTELIIEQFTGLPDKNGVEIYFNDIAINGESMEVVNDDWIYSVEYSKRHSDLNSRSIKHWEIIGNIHQNPELIK